MSRTQRLLVIFTTAVLIVTAIISFAAAVFFLRSVIFNLYKVEFLAQIAATIFLPLVTFCIAVLGIILLGQDNGNSKRKR